MAHSHPSYFKIYLWLLFLFVVSVIGPEVTDIKLIVLISAFGIAIVKAYLVCAHFMHLNVEKKYVIYMLFGMVTLLLVLFGGVAGDSMNKEGRNWKNDIVIEPDLSHHHDHSEAQGSHGHDGHSH